MVQRAQLFGVLGGVCIVVAALVRPSEAQAAAAQDWPPFVLVAGLLLIGVVADGDGLFSAIGHRLARRARAESTLFVGSVIAVALVTAVLNLDTSVAFLTPVMVYTTRKRGDSDGTMIYSCLLLSNAASLLLPGSNLTNLIVLGHLHLSGGAFFTRTAGAWLAAIAVTGVSVAVLEHRRSGSYDPQEPLGRPVIGVGAAAVAAAIVLVVALPSPALPVAGVGIAAAAVRVGQGRERLERVRTTLGLPVLVGLFGIAAALGVVGRSWSGPSELLTHLDPWATGGVGALASVALNNLPAASLLASRPPPHPYALLAGLNLGPNLFISGSLAWVLWLRAARSVGASPSVARAVRLGAVVTPLSLATTLAVLQATGAH